ncbi:alpha-L-fucosidase, partial [Halobacteria archaeon AArc-m2/3/4]|nr:alpha-L-fucosidase [Halobacteria archaeon AArc-m2/3/4]
RDGDCYAVALEWPGEELSLGVPQHVDAEPTETALLTADGELECETTVEGETLEVALPPRPDHEHAYAVRLSGVENPRL